MPRFCANLSLLFTELPLAERFAAAKAAGFHAVEIQFPYQLPAAKIATQLQQHDLQLVLCNLPAGDWEAGDRGLACDPGRIQAFRDGIDLALAYAKQLNVKQLNCLAGIPPPGLDPALAQQTLIDNLRHATSRLQAHGIRLLVEAINTLDVPGFFVCHTQQTLDLLDACSAQEVAPATRSPTRQNHEHPPFHGTTDCTLPSPAMQYDIYHMTRMGEDVAADLARHLPRIAHIQIADAPGRGEPGTGQIDFASLFDLLDQRQYDGWVGCEYHPRSNTLSSFDWMPGKR